MIATNRPTADVNVCFGAYMHCLPLAGTSVRSARGRLEEAWDIPPDAMAVVDGVAVDEDTVLSGGQMLIFVRCTGVMGRGSRFLFSKRRFP